MVSPMYLSVREEHAGRPKPYSDSQGRYWAARLKRSRFAWEPYAAAWAPTEREALERLREKVCLWPRREGREQAVDLICARRQPRRGSKAAAPTPPYHGGREEKLIDSTPTNALWETKYGSKKYWMITDYRGQMLEEYGGGFSKKRDAMSAWAEYRGRRAAATIKPGDWIIDPNARGLGQHSPKVVVKVEGAEIIYHWAGREIRVNMSKAIPTDPSYSDLLGYTGMKGAEGIKWRMETKGETFEEAARRMTSLRGYPPHTLKIMKAYILQS